jgi:hypothetical protein
LRAVFFAALVPALPFAAASALMRSQRRFVASLIAFRPAALNRRFRGRFAEAVEAVAVAVALPSLFFAAAHRFRCAAAMRSLAAALSGRRPPPEDGAAPPPDSAGAPFSIPLSSAICESIRCFCASKPSIAAAIISRVMLVDGM